MKTKSNFLLFFCLLCVFFAGCSYGDPRKFDTPTQGTEKLSIDDSYFLIFESQIYTFMAQYNDAVIYPSYKPEDELFKDLMNDSCDLIVASRELTNAEKSFFEQKSRFPKTVCIGEEALALVVNRSNKDSILTIQQVDSILSGKVENWNSVNANNNIGSLAVVIDWKNSSNARFLKDNFIHSDQFPKTITAATSNNEVISYVERNPGAIGVISSTWIADAQDSVCQNYLNRIQLVSIKKDEKSEAYPPFQGYISAQPTIGEIHSKHFLLPVYPGIVFSHDYPFTRKIFVINAENGNGLATGFLAFVSGEKGQLIILKSGIVPAIVPTRSVKVDPEH